MGHNLYGKVWVVSLFLCFTTEKGRFTTSLFSIRFAVPK